MKQHCNVAHSPALHCFLIGKEQQQAKWLGVIDYFPLPLLRSAVALDTSSFTFLGINLNSHSVPAVHFCALLFSALCSELKANVASVATT